MNMRYDEGFDIRDAESEKSFIFEIFKSLDQNSTQVQRNVLILEKCRTFENASPEVLEALKVIKKFNDCLNSLGKQVYAWKNTECYAFLKQLHSQIYSNLIQAENALKVIEDYHVFPTNLIDLYTYSQLNIRALRELTYIIDEWLAEYPHNICYNLMDRKAPDITTAATSDEFIYYLSKILYKRASVAKTSLYVLQANKEITDAEAALQNCKNLMQLACSVEQGLGNYSVGQGYNKTSEAFGYHQFVAGIHRRFSDEFAMLTQDLHHTEVHTPALAQVETWSDVMQQVHKLLALEQVVTEWLKR